MNKAAGEICVQIERELHCVEGGVHMVDGCENLLSLRVKSGAGHLSVHHIHCEGAPAGHRLMTVTTHGAPSAGSSEQRGTDEVGNEDN